MSDGSQESAWPDKVFHKNIKPQLRGLVRDHVSVVNVTLCNKYTFIVTQCFRSVSKRPWHDETAAASKLSTKLSTSRSVFLS